ncbi:endonuclease/exonuclease/phosphatase family protein [Hydrogenimonas cancrithermarum]|uniref:UPF0294 protein n=1 Tax=Hydrogenimonas cancrithermarum TaxID=2993563 RepID=A0ABM8FNA5_9BACT|nr:endonuclease/exonuclease/phosphatase family protein [Hydrogenimonas cancrithermarum]BDY13234.1 UPF0294 protein [Hydrogenimonas cancrithermarum]
MALLHIVSWNVQKRTLSASFYHTFEALVKSCPADLLLFQEARMPHDRLPTPLRGYFHAMGSNFARFRHRFGVLTLSHMEPIETYSYHSKVRELGFATRKSALLTRYRLAGDETLSLLNIHAINFVPYRLFARELDAISHLLDDVVETRLVVAGDFNTWSPKRRAYLEEVMARHSLHHVHPRHARAVKSVLGEPLDHIFYRGIVLMDAFVLETPVSDHNPICAKFRV